jgi:hypothetical protein
MKMLCDGLCGMRREIRPILTLHGVGIEMRVSVVH